MMRSLFALLLLLLFILISASAYSATYGTCTDGTDCYCDQVADNGSDLYDASVLHCEDWDAATLYSDTGFGAGAPNYGPWYDPSGSPWGYTYDRGYNSYFNRTYTAGSTGQQWSNGEPASPTYGSPCNAPASCSGSRSWVTGDINNGNSTSPYLAFYTQASDFSSHISGSSGPENTATNGSGVFDGNGSLGLPVYAGSTMSIVGEHNWTAVTEIGMTMAVALADNFSESALVFEYNGRCVESLSQDCNWKWNEYIQAANPGSGFDGLAGFGNSNSDQFPAYFFILVGSANCAAVVSGATELVGEGFGCSGDYVIGYGDSTLYTYTNTGNGFWGDGSWACVRSYLNISTGVYQMWMKTANMDETLLIHITGMNFSGTDPASGYDGYKLNMYANSNQGGGGGPTFVDTARYEDNLHITNGTPVSCAAIGFNNSPEPGPSRSLIHIHPAILVSLLAGLLGGLLYACNSNWRDHCYRRSDRRNVGEAV